MGVCLETLNDVIEEQQIQSEQFSWPHKSLVAKKKWMISQKFHIFWTIHPFNILDQIMKFGIFKRIKLNLLDPQCHHLTTIQEMVQTWANITKNPERDII